MYTLEIIKKILLALCIISTSVYAGEVKRETDKDVIWQAGVDGVEIEWAPDGTFNRIYSSFYQPVKFPDRSGIGKAQIIAEEKAKAAIVRFMSQNVSSSRLVEQVDTDSETATRTQDVNGDAISKETKRKMVESLTEITNSYAAGKLRGVIILEKGYDDKREEAWVKVGISKKTMNASQGLSEAISNPNQARKSSSQGTGGKIYQESEVRQSNQKDW